MLPLVRAMLLLLMLPFSAEANALTVDITPEFRSQSLGTGLNYAKEQAREQAEAQGKELTPEQAVAGLAWNTANTPQLNLGFHETPYWIMFRVNNPTNVSQDMIIEVDNIYIDRIEFNVLNNQDKVINKTLAGDRTPVSQWTLPHAHFLHQISVPSQSTVTVLIKVHSSSAISLPMTLWNTRAFIEHDFQRTTSLGIFFGILLMLSAYHAIISALTRDLSSLYYAIYIFSILSIFLLREGVVSLLVWPESGLGTESANIFAISMAGSSISLFTSRILQLKHASPTLNRLFYLSAVLCVLPCFFVFLIDYGLLIRISLILSLALTGLYVVALLKRIKDKYPAARHLAVASVFAVLGITIAIFTVLGKLPVNPLNQLIIYGCITTMAFFFALSISYRINLDRSLREEAQKKLTHRLDELVREQTDELEKANSRLKVISITDGLTGLYNRRHFDQVLATEYNRAYREHTPVAILIFDIDHFKAINDGFGHGFGDLCLRESGQIIKSITRRPTDIAARYGGEEFAILLPDTDLQGANHAAERLLQAFRKSAVAEGETGTNLTVSIGVACEIPEEKDQHIAFLKRADQWLYKAKHNGRDRAEGDSP